MTTCFQPASDTFFNANIPHRVIHMVSIPEQLQGVAEKVLNGKAVRLNSRMILSWFEFQKSSRHQMEIVRAAFAAVGIRPRVDLTALEDVDSRIDILSGAAL